MLYGKDIFVKLYNKNLLQRFTEKVWRNGLVYLILRPGISPELVWSKNSCIVLYLLAKF